MSFLRLSLLRAAAYGSLLVAVFSSALFSQQEPPKKFASHGVFEFGGSATFQSTTPVVNGKTGSAEYALVAMPYVGYFVVDGFEIGMNPIGVGLQHSGGNTITELRFFLAPAYNFRARAGIYPFVEGLAGLTSEITSAGGSTNTKSGFSWGGRGGVKIAVTEKGLLTVGVQYLQITLNSKGVSTRNGTNELSASFGFTVWL